MHARKHHGAYGWELWREGTIERKKIVMEKNGTAEVRKFVLEFENGEDVKSGRFHKWEDIKEGSTGHLYCWDGMDSDNTYMWVSKGGVSVSSLKKKEKPKGGLFLTVKTGKFYSEDAKDEEVTPLPKRYEWHNLVTSPPIHQIVLVKFKNGIVTTAHYTPMKEWKAEIDRKKLSGGIALKNVVQWKIVDLE